MVLDCDVITETRRSGATSGPATASGARSGGRKKVLEAAGIKDGRWGLIDVVYRDTDLNDSGNGE